MDQIVHKNRARRFGSRLPANVQGPAPPVLLILFRAKAFVNKSQGHPAEKTTALLRGGAPLLQAVSNPCMALSPKWG